MITKQDKDMFLKQMEAMKARTAKSEQLRHLDTIMAEHDNRLSESDLILSLERTFFLNRLEANATLNEWLDLQ